MSVQSKVAAALAEGPKTVEQIASEVGAHPQSVRVALWKMQQAGLATNDRKPNLRRLLWQAVQAQEAA